MALTKFERLEQAAHDQSVEIFTAALPERIRGLFYDDGCIRIITLNSAIRTVAIRLATLAEELGHHVVGGGNILFGNLPYHIRCRIEARARAYAYGILLPIAKLLPRLRRNEAYWEIAENFEVPQDFVEEAIRYYSSKGLIPYWGVWDEACCEWVMPDENEYDWGA